MPYDLSLKDLFRKAYETLGADRLIFGTDSSYFPRGFSVEYLREQLKICYDLGMTDESIQRIFHDNAAELLKL
jgi:predicted TIM-barrel fold metal-dependent hydrolase